MRYYISAYDVHGHEILGNLDGQGVLLDVKNYKRTLHYKALPTFRTLNNRIHHYKIFDDNNKYLETVYNSTFVKPSYLD
jgi:hypothetical protein